MKKLIVLSILLIAGCDILKEEDVHGCTDITANNYNSNANIFNNSCTYCEYGDYWDVGKQNCTECESVDDCPDLCEEGFWGDFMIHECVECGIGSSSGNSNNIGC